MFKHVIHDVIYLLNNGTPVNWSANANCSMHDELLPTKKWISTVAFHYNFSITDRYLSIKLYQLFDYITDSLRVFLLKSN